MREKTEKKTKIDIVWNEEGNIATLPSGKTLTFEGSLRMKDVNAWGKAETAGDLETCWKYLADLVVEWDWSDLDPTSAGAYGELWMHEYLQVTAAAGEYLRSAPRGKD